ncbi:MAG: mycothiol system anti-sigma-R factor [Actinobacteria bacterium]|nr:mycothiol system anti-sigma-R factor [Actinomycetota bacterium]
MTESENSIGPATIGKCREALMHIYTYLDGEVTQEVRVEISRHLADCQPCDHAFGFEAELKALVSRSCCESVPPGLRERIASALGLT